MSTQELVTLSLKEIVTHDFHAAAVFEKYSLDFCCHGGKTIDEACKEKGVRSEKVLIELKELESQPQGSSVRYGDWGVDLLVEFIVRNHHAYVTKMVPVISAHTQKVASVHGARHPEVIQIAAHFEAVAQDLLQHMQKEERILFPRMKELARSKESGHQLAPSPFGSLQNPIRMMEMEHASAGDEMGAIRQLSSGYAPPDDACTTYRISYQELRDFELDLHQHVHLENNILFPKAIQLESELLATN